ncbi:universal stress protein [Paraburkholderia lycopersici]|uniref:Nucleotide-binding universal stress protein, UspA family n=1 Tax=Paraburkholderia lycopersici TaxID=416944 RepID=A0A1G6SEU2_9BURK|nr:universal stress protein [Paraburkholderia lycopersici]SDD14687.1 Nucleotide-binding universal stress protein, UspA family [Paraburkholderia lycopersici]
MSYKTVLTYLDPGDRAQARLDFSLQLAREFDAHLIGLYTTFMPEAREYFAVAGCARHYDGLCDTRRGRRDAAEEAFRHALGAAGRGGEWIAFDDHAEQPLIRRSRHADLLIAGQAGPDDDAQALRKGFLEEVVLTSGRPVLVLPYAGALRPAGKSIAIAWDGSREAARAVHDAMPFLARAGRVTVLRIRTADSARPAALGAQGKEIDLMLARHAVNVDYAQATSDSDETAGDTLLSWLASSGCDLVVAGAYSHPQWKEHWLGGVTRALLESATVPVLLSH